MENASKDMNAYAAFCEVDTSGLEQDPQLSILEMLSTHNAQRIQDRALYSSPGTHQVLTSFIH